jgi:cytosine/adenosine deaminase-related metal-dependent hydrolase
MTDSNAAVRLLRNATVLPMNSRDPLCGHDVEIVDGVIHKIGKNLEPTPGATVENLHGDYLLPGFIHAHIHLCQTLFRHEAEARTLVPWLRERILPFEAAHTPDSVRVSAQLGIGELLLSGATALLDMGTVQHTDHVAQTIYEQGIRATFGKAMMDRPTPGLDALNESTAESIDASMTLAKQWHGADEGRIRYGFAPRWVLSCTADLQKEIAQLAEEHDYLIHTLNTLGLASDRSVFAHCIHLDQSERDVLASTGTSVAHCPSANMQLGSGICDVPTLLKQGINVGIGADGAPCNNALDGFREMLLAHHLQSLKHHPDALTPREILEMMTMGGARALRIDDRVGSIEVGKDADLIRLERRDFRLGYGSDPFTQIVLCGSRDLLKTLWVRGEALVEDGTLTRMNGSELHTRAVDERRALLDRVS